MTEIEKRGCWVGTDGQWILDPECKINVDDLSYDEEGYVLVRGKSKEIIEESDMKENRIVKGYDPVNTPFSDCSSGDFFHPDPKILPWRSEEYRNHVRSYPCASCQKPGPSQFHHESLKNQGWGTKPPDFQGVPLCPVCHQLEECGQGMPKEDKLKAMVKCLGAWVQDVERIFKGLV